MTTNDAAAETPRGQLAEAVDMQMTDCYVEKAGELLQVGDAYDIAMGVIAHIWQAADDPAVQDAVADGIRHLNDEQGEWGDPAQAIITATLTALIGPRPQGENDER